MFVVLLPVMAAFAAIVLWCFYFLEYLAGIGSYSCPGFSFEKNAGRRTARQLHEGGTFQYLCSYSYNYRAEKTL